HPRLVVAHEDIHRVEWAAIIDGGHFLPGGRLACLREAALHERYDGGRDVRVRHEPDQPALAPGGLFLDLRKRPGEVHRAQLAEDAAPVTPEQHADVVPVVDAAGVLI